ncbi:electron transporter, partial [Streptomyces sp. T21Q-yed]|nr:electron transporter [Streptomyces sp. T21Q-yed]
MGRVRKTLGRRWFVGVLVLAVVAGGFGLYWFQPWKLWQDKTVEEALPQAARSPASPAVAPSPADA